MTFDLLISYVYTVMQMKFIYCLPFLADSILKLESNNTQHAPRYFAVLCELFNLQVSCNTLHLAAMLNT